MRTLWDKRMRSTDVYGSGGMGVTALEHPLVDNRAKALLIALEPAIEREMRALRAISSAGRLIQRDLAPLSTCHYGDASDLS
jgi:hypothetical protein